MQMHLAEKALMALKFDQKEFDIKNSSWREKDAVVVTRAFVTLHTHLYNVAVRIALIDLEYLSKLSAPHVVVVNFQKTISHRSVGAQRSIWFKTKTSIGCSRQNARCVALCQCRRRLRVLRRSHCNACRIHSCPAHREQLSRANRSGTRDI